MSASMAEGIAEVLLAHSSVTYECDYDGRGNDGIWCNQCGGGEDNPSADEDEWIAAHQAEQLAANGYGKLEDAWDECEAAEYEIRLNPESNAWEAVKDNPYRSQQ